MLPDHERFRLYFGTYKQPRYNYGDVVTCAARGRMKIIRQTDAPIPWPVGMPIGTGRNRGRGTLVLFKDLARAVRKESAQAVGHWWGVSYSVVHRWRIVLDVNRTNAGTAKLIDAAVRNDADRNGKIAASRVGKPNLAYVPPMKGKKHSAKTRKRMSEVHTSSPWQAWEDQLLLDYVPSAEVAEKTSRALRLVYQRRKELGSPDARSREFRQKQGGKR